MQKSTRSGEKENREMLRKTMNNAHSIISAHCHDDAEIPQIVDDEIISAFMRE